MKLKVVRSRTEQLDARGNKGHLFTLRIVAEVTEDENELLMKYDGPDLRFAMNIALPGEEWRNRFIAGPSEVSLEQLKGGLEWSKGRLSPDFVEIPAAIQAVLQRRLQSACACAEWGGEEVFDV